MWVQPDPDPNPFIFYRFRPGDLSDLTDLEFLIGLIKVSLILDFFIRLFLFNYWILLPHLKIYYLPTQLAFHPHSFTKYSNNDQQIFKVQAFKSQICKFTFPYQNIKKWVWRKQDSVRLSKPTSVLPYETRKKFDFF